MSFELSQLSDYVQNGGEPVNILINMRHCVSVLVVQNLHTRPLLKEVRPAKPGAVDIRPMYKQGRFYTGAYRGQCPCKNVPGPP